MGYSSCPICHGSGENGEENCPVCGGAGRNSSFPDEQCYHCGGRGRVNKQCSACSGSGQVADSSSNSSSYSSPSYSSPSYTPSYSSPSYSPSGYTNQRNGFVSFIFGLVCGFGAALTIGWIYNNLTGASRFPIIPFLVLLAVGLSITFNAWRNRKAILFLIMLALSLPGWLVTFGVIPEHLRTNQTASASSTATVTADALNFRSGPGTSHDIIKTLKKGDTLTVTGGTENGWTPVSHNGDTGWVSAEMISAGGTVTQTTSGGQAASGTTGVGTPQENTVQAAPAVPVKEGRYTIRPRIRGKENANNMDLWLDRIEVQGRNFSVFYTGSATGKGGDGHFQPFWHNPHFIKLEDLDRPGQSFGVTDTGEDDDSGNPRATNGFYNTFQDVSGTRFRLISSADSSTAWIFEFTLGEPE